MTTQDIDIPEGWIETTLSEVIKTNISSIDKNFTFDDLLYLDTGSITENRIEQIQNVKISDAPSRARRLVKDGDIVYSTVRPNQKHFGFITNPPENLVVSTGFTVISSIPEKSDSKFLYYFLTQEQITNELQQIAEHSTSTYPSIRPENIENLSILLPQLPEQKEIAAILSSFDDKIELLRKQNETLEKTAQTIFQEWFGKYSIDDELPEGWRVGKVKDFGQIVCGKTPSKENSDYFGGDIPFIKIPDMHGEVYIVKTDDTLTDDGANTQKNKFIPKNSICVSCIATVGLVVITSESSQTNQQINSLIPNKDFYLEYLYFTFLNLKDELIAIGSGGSATLNINTSVFSNIEILFPEEQILEKFHELAKPLFSKILTNLLQIQSLSKARDELLPKLMSGEVRVI